LDCCVAGSAQERVEQQIRVRVRVRIRVTARVRVMVMVMASSAISTDRFSLETLLLYKIWLGFGLGLGLRLWLGFGLVLGLNLGFGWGKQRSLHTYSSYESLVSCGMFAAMLMRGSRSRASRRGVFTGTVSPLSTMRNRPWRHL